MFGLNKCVFISRSHKTVYSRPILFALEPTKRSKKCSESSFEKKYNSFT